MSKGKANERINSQMVAPKARSSSIVFVVLVAGVIILILGGVVLFQMFRNSAAANDGAYNTVITPDNVEEIIAQLDEREYTPVGSFEVSMPTVWTFPDGQSASTDAFVDNVVNNRNTVYFTVVMSEAPEDVIYQSPYIEVGARLEDIKLDVMLEAGTYDGIITYYLVDEEMKDLSSVSVSISLIVES